ncbi:MAG: DUF1315 family protein [Oceanospirillales bacterium]|uniref:DUF1315 family protein n=1 Tax=Marinobacterium halophilum TaxID=267374 RepID=A0A2P8EUS9_9GAMM|nr:DUF1315 family protein [Marinobacterium halophilum]MBR9829991.1 DUF1315 family protein [Oceanospirillales bacterium]PSL13227.1 hypothetical protein CLV44_11365 [Marinobacterium halophilum]
MTFEKMIEAMTPEVYQSLRRAVELGKWPNGQRLVQEQRETSLRAVIAYEYKHGVAEDQRVGYIDRTRSDGAQHGTDPFQPQVLKILTDD